ncbi:MAG TPA: glycosyltransferase family 39 protein [Candidatus Dormibacteraeota bacterium]|nr:glycosyltransferase family 39 protein [Candidatus Dormibacteraeota bacterium]
MHPRQAAAVAGGLRAALPASRGRVARAWARLRADEGFRLAVTVAVLMRVVLGIAALIVRAIQGPATGPLENHPEAATATTSPFWPLVGPFERWDGLWYLHIAGTGYPAHGPEAAFSPLFPLLVRVVSLPLGGRIGLAAFAVDTVAAVLALWAVWHAVDDALGSAVATRTVLLLSVFPGAFFLLAPYPEGLVLALAAGALLLARRRAWLAAGGLAALAALCRPQGAVLAPALLVEAVAAAGWRPLRIGWRPLAAVALPAAALGAWFVYCMAALGLRLGPLTALTNWGHRTVWPWQVLADSGQAVVEWRHSEELGNLCVALGLLLLLPLIARRLPPGWTAYTAVAIAFSLANEPMWTPLMSLMRYAVTLFPAFALVATWRLPRWAWVATGIVAAGAELYLLQSFVHRLFVA